MKIRLASEDILSDSIVDGDGLRAVLFTQGCSHNCLGCHNPQTHDFNKGIEVDIEEVKKYLDNLSLQDGITLSGGDPFFQPEASLEICKYAKEIGLSVWAYTGFLFEDLIKSDKMINLLKYIDVLVDGPFVLEKKSYDLLFRGSSNQRIINVKTSLKDKKVHRILKYDKNKSIKKDNNKVFI